MSRIYFSTRSGEWAEVRGAERAHMGLTLADATQGLIPDKIEGICALFGEADQQDMWGEFKKQHAELLAAEQYGQAAELQRRAWDSARIQYRVGWDCAMHIGGKKHNSFGVLLNTAIVMGGEPLQLFAKLHGCVEIHGWVAGKNREWLANIIDKGRATGLYRDGMGWDSVIKLLRKSKRGAVVTAYSVTDCFNWKKDKLDKTLEFSPERLPVLFDDGAHLFQLNA